MIPQLYLVRTGEKLHNGEGTRGLLFVPVPGQAYYQQFHTLEPTPTGTPGHRLVKSGSKYRCQVEAHLSPENTRTARIRIFWNDPDGEDSHQIHIGNTLADTRGCILVGNFPIDAGVGNSVAAMNELLKLIGGGTLRAPRVGTTLNLTVTSTTPTH